MRATGVAMPEATVNEDRETIAAKDNVRLSGKIAGVEAETMASRVECGADQSLRRGVLPSDARHLLRTSQGLGLAPSSRYSRAYR